MIERLLAAEAALEHGDEAAAERVFTTLAEADPRNAIAVVGLARLALRRGDAVAAEALARQALGIDPDEAAAHGLLETLAAAGAPEPLAPASQAQGAPAPVARTPGLLVRLRRWLRGGPLA